MKVSIDLNCDLGEWKTKEGPNLDKAIMPYISSCNIACGGHIGDEYSIKKTVELALEYGVKIGAHPSFPDKKGFGRTLMKMENSELQESIISQIERVQSALVEFDTELHHIKPHGALYNEASKNQVLSKVILKAIDSINVKPIIYGAYNSVFETITKGFGLTFYAEGFADRVYEDDLSLRSRSLNGAVMQTKEEVLQQVQSMVFEQKVRTYSGQEKHIKVDTICLHSDTLGSQKLAKQMYQFMDKHGVTVG